MRHNGTQIEANNARQVWLLFRHQVGSKSIKIVFVPCINRIRIRTETHQSDPNSDLRFFFNDTFCGSTAAPANTPPAEDGPDHSSRRQDAEQDGRTRTAMSHESCLRDFRDLKLIGKGSFGRVYRCIRVSDGGEYAMKEVAIKAMSQREREDAVNEVRILASVNHQMVIRFSPPAPRPPPSRASRDCPLRASARRQCVCAPHMFGPLLPHMFAPPCACVCVIFTVLSVGDLV